MQKKRCNWLDEVTITEYSNKSKNYYIIIIEIERFDANLYSKQN